MSARTALALPAGLLGPGSRFEWDGTTWTVDDDPAPVAEFGVVAFSSHGTAFEFVADHLLPVPHVEGAPFQPGESVRVTYLAKGHGTCLSSPQLVLEVERYGTRFQEGGRSWRVLVTVPEDAAHVDDEVRRAQWKNAHPDFVVRADD